MLLSKNITAYTIFFLYRVILFPVLFFIPLFLEEKGITGWRVGLLLGESTLTGIFLALPFGLLNDRFKSKILLAFSLLCGAVFLLLFSQVQVFIGLVFLFLLFGLCHNLFQISFDSLFLKKIIQGKGATHVGRYIVVYSVAGACGLMLTAIFANSVSLGILYMSAGFILLIAMLLCKKLHFSPTVKISALEYKNDILKPRFIIFGFLIFLFTLHWGAESTCYGLFLKHYLHLDARMSAVYMLAEFVTMGISAYIITLLIDRYKLDLKWIFASGIFVSGITLVLKVNPCFTISLIMRMLHGIGDGMLMIVIYYGLAKVFNIRRIGGNMSALVFMQLSGSFVGAVVFSRIGKLYGYHSVFIISGWILMCAAALVAMFNVYGTYSRKPRSTSS